MVLNGQTSVWFDIQAVVPKGSILGLLLFLLCVNDLLNDSRVEYKLFAYVTSLFSIIYDVNTFASDINQTLS